ncbi:MAG: molecular chaperone DnaJ [Clostridia bacterium]|jgi:molecular chaperone DnaJ
MAEKRDYYEVLGLNKGAVDADIKKAYRKLAKKHHPDMNSGDKISESKFKEISEAYEVLSDPEKKSRYDQFGHAGTNPNGFGSGFGGAGYDFGGFGDIFESFFGGTGFGGRTSRTRNGPQRGADLKYTCEVTFEQSAFGTEKEITINRMDNCETCKGTGAKPGTSPTTCKKCNGTGQIQYRQSTPFGQFVNSRTCDVCHGEGKINISPCADCNGKGKVRKSRKIKFSVPHGIDDGQVVSLRGEGEPGSKGGPSGDLFITVRVKQHQLFSRQGNNVICEIPITFMQATLGAEIEVPTLDGRVKYSIPEGTQTGSIFRLKNKGVMFLRGNGRGDQFVKVTVEVPKKLTEKQKALLREFAELTADNHAQRKSFFDKMKEVLGK